MTSVAGQSEPARPRDDTETELSITEVAERTGLSRDTLRYYEKAGLITAVGRSSGGRRRYVATDLAWLQFLLRLRATGMSVADMKCFADLRRAGDGTIADRLALLRTHQTGVARHIANLQVHLVALADKVDLNQSLLEEYGGTDVP